MVVTETLVVLAVSVYGLKKSYHRALVLQQRYIKDHNRKRLAFAATRRIFRTLVALRTHSIATHHAIVSARHRAQTWWKARHSTPPSPSPSLSLGLRRPWAGWDARAATVAARVRAQVAGPHQPLQLARRVLAAVRRLR